MGGFLPIYATGFWTPVIDVFGRIAVPAVHGYRLAVVLWKEFGLNPGGRKAPDLLVRTY
jgi:hypothetical protein